MSQFPELVVLMSTVLTAVITLLIFVIKLAGKKSTTTITLQCSQHPLMEERMRNLASDIAELKNSDKFMESRMAGISAHITSIEGKIDILSNKLSGDGQRNYYEHK